VLPAKSSLPEELFKPTGAKILIILELLQFSHFISQPLSALLIVTTSLTFPQSLHL
jgi:hypothetical protein